MIRTVRDTNYEMARKPRASGDDPDFLMERKFMLA